MNLEDVLLLWYVKGKRVGFPIPQYWQYTYKVDNVMDRIQQHLYDGLLTTAIVRGNEKYVATDNGDKLLSQYSHIIYYHSYRNTLEPTLTLQSVDRLYKADAYTSVEDFFIEYHTKMMYDYWSNSKYGLARNALLSVAEIYFRMSEYEQALANFLSVSYLDMTGLDNCTQYRTEFTAKDKENLQLAPGIVSYIVICLRNLNATPTDLPTAFNLAVANINIPYAVYSKQEVLKFIDKKVTAAWSV